MKIQFDDSERPSSYRKRDAKKRYKKSDSHPIATIQELEKKDRHFPRDILLLKFHNKEYTCDQYAASAATSCRSAATTATTTRSAGTSEVVPTAGDTEDDEALPEAPQLRASDDGDQKAGGFLREPLQLLRLHD